VIAGLVTFTARGVHSPQEMRATLLGRIDALARAHDLVKMAIGGGFADAESTPRHTTLRVLAEALLSPFRTVADRLRIEGEDVDVGALSAAPLALVLHELATNAARYGALTRPSGNLTLRWTRADGQLQLFWDEHLGQVEAPMATQPSGQGIGQRLVTQSVLQLGGRAAFNWRPEGLLVEVSLPLARLEN
jgi:two-component sensor histidine kinase